MSSLPVPLSPATSTGQRVAREAAHLIGEAAHRDRRRRRRPASGSPGWSRRPRRRSSARTTSVEWPMATAGARAPPRLAHARASDERPVAASRGPRWRRRRRARSARSAASSPSRRWTTTSADATTSRRRASPCRAPPAAPPRRPAARRPTSPAGRETAISSVSRRRRRLFDVRRHARSPFALPHRPPRPEVACEGRAMLADARCRASCGARSTARSPRRRGAPSSSRRAAGRRAAAARRR